MNKRWLAAIALLLSLLLTAVSCGTQASPPQVGVWDNSKWDQATWQ